MKFVFLLLVLLAPNLGSAHELPIERELMVQYDGDTLQILMVYREPPGARSDRLKALYDTNRDGRITGSESKGMHPEMLRRATHQLRFQLDGHTIVPTSTDIKIVSERTGGFSAAILFEYRKVGFGRLSVEVGSAAGTLPLQVQAVPGAHLKGPEALELEPGKSAHFDLQPPTDSPHTP